MHLPLKEKQIIRISLVLLLSLVSYYPSLAQRFGRHEFDFKRFNLGFQVGINYSTYDLEEDIMVSSPGYSTIAERIEMNPQPGLRLSIITNLNLHNNLALRFIPGVSLEQRNFKFFFDDGTIEDRKVEATYLYLPLLFQFKSDYYNKTRFYVVGGGQMGINFASNKRVRDDPSLLKINQQDFNLVVGLGFNLYGDKIKLSPELTYSFGLKNIYEPEFTTHAEAIQSLRSQVLALIINFE